jgi:hypothetical protein
MKIEQANALAERFHLGQFDKAGRPFIEHPRRVSKLVTAHEEKLTALLHDLLEDAALTPADLMCAGTPQRVIQAVMALTRAKHESYRDFVLRAAHDPIARAVKIADITDNTSEERLRLLDEKVASRLRAKYADALSLLSAAPDTGENSVEIDFGALVPEGESLEWWTCYCDECGNPAGTVEVIRDDAKVSGRRIGISLTVHCVLGTANFRVPSEKTETCRNAIVKGNMTLLYNLDPEITPWWCAVCEKSYCERSWLLREKYDDGRFDGVGGTCPRGHSRTLWD